jgi:hypothetical protein
LTDLLNFLYISKIPMSAENLTILSLSLELVQFLCGSIVIKYVGRYLLS